MDKELIGCRRAVWAALAVWALVGFAGCSRNFYRVSADREVSDILAEKNKYPQWRLEQWHVYPDPRARFADPTNPDRPPMPPDDEAAWMLSPHPQRPGLAGVGEVRGTGYLEMIKQWDTENRGTRHDVNVDPLAVRKRPIQAYYDDALRVQQEPFVLSFEQAIELGVVNSPTYQSFREQLYLAALPVTLQRFSFAFQWAAIADFIRQYAGPTAAGGAKNNWTASSSIGFNKLFVTGALLTADFANSTVWNFNGGGLTSVSNTTVSLTQPFLQGGGKAVTLEPLTLAERNLFYSLRAFARFREQYNVAVALGTSLPSSLPAAANVTTTGSPISTLAALGIASTDVAGGFVGYLSTLYRTVDMAADKKLVKDLQRALKILEAYQEGGMYSPLQVDQTRSALLNASNTVLTDQQFVTNALDQFKLVLGLPANTPIMLDDTLARPITNQLDAYYAVIDDSEQAQGLVDKQDKTEPAKLRAKFREILTTEPVTKGNKFQTRLPASWDTWSKLAEKELQARLFKLGGERRKLFDLKTELDLKMQVLPPEQEARLREVEFEIDLGVMEQMLRRYEAKPWEKAAKLEQREQDRVKLFRLTAAAAKNVLVWARNERFEDVTNSWPTPLSVMLGDLDLLTTDVNLAQQEAVKAALTNRVDLMNARAQVVDAWRQVRVTANALLGVFTTQYLLNSQTTPNGTHPFAFGPGGTNQELIFNFQLPLNRLAQRNVYRTSLINFQVARRSLITLQDSIAAQVRFDVRQLQLFNANYANQKKLLRSLYSQVENALEVIVAPSDPDQLKASSTSGQANAAALTNQYLGALNNLNGAQTRMYDIWLSLYATRMQLYLDLERLRMDQRGVWVDEMAALRATAGDALPASEPIAPPQKVGAAAPQPAGKVEAAAPQSAGNVQAAAPVTMPAPRGVLAAPEAADGPRQAGFGPPRESRIFLAPPR